MTPERWKQIDQLFEEALGQPPEQRAAFVADACSGDEALRQEVEALLRSGERAGSFMETRAAELATLLAAHQAGRWVGRQVGSYRVLSPLGAGGMGEVYVAEDTRLGRK